MFYPNYNKMGFSGFTCSKNVLTALNVLYIVSILYIIMLTVGLSLTLILK